MNNQQYVYLKLGGSLITNKDVPLSPRLEEITRLAKEVATVKKKNPKIKLILGHGSGSFGHTTAKQYDTVSGAKTETEWAGFADVWFQARALNQLVMKALHHEQVPAVSVDISSAWISNNKSIMKVDTELVEKMLANGIVPVVYGNVLLDQKIGATIFSTEKIFAVLSETFIPERILIAGVEDGIWADFPKKNRLIDKITSDDLPYEQTFLQGSEHPDVTGGMQSKVATLFPLLNKNEDGYILIFNGSKKSSVADALTGKKTRGTLLVMK